MRTRGTALSSVTTENPRDSARLSRPVGRPTPCCQRVATALARATRAAPAATPNPLISSHFNMRGNGLEPESIAGSGEHHRMAEGERALGSQTCAGLYCCLPHLVRNGGGHLDE